MTLVKKDDGGVWVSGPLAGAVVAAILGLFTLMYQFQNDKLWEDGSDIAQLKVSATDATAESLKLETSLGVQSQTLTSILGAMQSLKDSNDTLKDQIRELHKQVTDLDLMLRPLRPSP